MIVVGVDGSRAGLDAAGWAAREARLRGVELRVVHAMPRWACEASEDGRFADVAKWMHDGGAAWLDAGVERARSEAPDLSVVSGLLPGDPRQALIDASRTAELLVVGNHGLGGFRGLLVGSVAYGVAGHASCDVVVVRDQTAPSRAEVIVGVDGSSAGVAVLGFAFTEASLRGAKLRAVHAWKPLFGDGEDQEGETRLLAEALAGWQERFPDVSIVEEVVKGHPVEVLGQAAEGADLLVVGSHGHGELAGMILGSVSQAMLHHAPCPIAIVRAS